MNLQAGPELDTKIAEACGIAVVPCENKGRIVKKTEHYDQLEGVPYVGKYGDFFEPSTDLNAAFEAAEKCGLFHRHCIWRSDATGWVVSHFDSVDGAGRRGHESLALEICAAILALKL